MSSCQTKNGVVVTLRENKNSLITLLLFQKIALFILLRIHNNYRHESLGHYHFCIKNRRKILKEIKTQKNI